MNPPTDIQTWLEERGLGELARVFEENHITPDLLHALTADDLRDMGITSLGYRKKLLAALAELNAPEAAIAPASQAPPEPAPLEPTPTLAPPEPTPTPEPIPELTPQTVQQFKAAPRLVPLKAAAPVVAEVTAPAPEPVMPALEPLPVPSGRKSRRKAFSGGFLLASVCVHILLGVGAVYWVVQKIETKRKLQFASGPPTSNPSKRALEHKVSLQKKKNAGGSPAQARRIAVTGLASKITLPEMPAVPTTSTQFVAGRMAGMGGAGFGSGMGIGNGSGMGIGGMGGGGAGLTMFGARGGAGLTGTFYDLKQTRFGRPSSISTIEDLAKQLSQFTHSGWNQRFLDKFFKAPTNLRATHLLIPYVQSEEAPDAFGVKKFVKPSLWMVHYKGRVSPPENGTWRFVGGGDNFVIVRLNGKVVLDCGFPNYDGATDFNAAAKYTYNGFQIGSAGGGNPGVAGGVPGGFAVGEAMNLQADKSYDMEMIIGDDGGLMFFTLLVQKEGVQYERDGSGNPILPPFRLGKAELPKGNQPPYRPDGPIWRAQSDGGSGFNANGGR